MTAAPASDLAEAIRAAHGRGGGPALVPYVTAGFPTREAFRGVLRAVAPHAAAIEVGVPFSDPMADGATIQRASRVALEQGVTLRWVLEEVAAVRAELGRPVALMGYLNPFLRMGFSELARACAGAGVSALIIPDLPLEESEEARAALHGRSVGLVQLVTPGTPPARLARIGAASDGFLYAVTTAGITGSVVAFEGVLDYLRRAREASPVPVCAGFGVRGAADLATLAPAVDGVIVGSALVQAVERGEDPGRWLAALRGAA